MYKNISTDTNQGTFIITINRPDKMNALNIATMQELGMAIQEAVDDINVQGIIITGAGEKAFVAGADISEFAHFTADQGKEMGAAGHAVYNSIEQCCKPVIAAVNGFALGGGCELAMACHMRVASTKAKFGQPEVNLGIIPGYGGTQRLVQLIGKGKALELLMTADMITAEEAWSLGLVNHVVAPEELMYKCYEILGKIARKGPIAIAHVIACANAVYDESRNGYDMEIQAFGDIMNSQDFKEGTSAFMEKREANFTGE